jgi:transcriptional repressor NrdR
MVCIYCSEKTKVTNSRESKRTPGTWRRRQCLNCDALFTSRENADLSQTHVVEHTDSSVKPFSRDLLFMSIYDSCKHRKTAPEDATALTDTIITGLLQDSHEATLPTSQIIRVATRTLQKFDPVAGALYRAYYA